MYSKDSKKEDHTPTGADVYSKLVLSIYDLFVLGLSNTFAWKISNQLILDLYNKHVSEKHLDVGVGTGYFLDKCKFPSSHPHIALIDLNTNSLETTAQRLSRYHPQTFVANILEPLPSELRGFQSIGLNYLLHCLPGNMLSKSVVFENLKPLINPGGVIFGTTILGQGVKQNLMARKLISIYNRRGIFSNISDSVEDIEIVLKQNFRDYELEIVGCVAIFVGRT